MPSPPSLTLLAFDIHRAFTEMEFQLAFDHLNAEEHEHILRNKFQNEQHLALASLLLRRFHFTKYLGIPWDAVQFYRLPEGKPAVMCTEDQSADFNVSHDGHWVVLCASNSSPLQVGIDLVTVNEPMGEPTDRFLQCYRSHLTDAEWDIIHSSTYPLRTFYEIWGCKESYAKAVGKGLRLELRSMSFRNDESENVIDMILDKEMMPEWHHHISRLDEKTIAVVCFGPNDACDPSDTYAFAQTTQMLGQEPTTMHPYTIVTWQDILSVWSSSM